MKIVKINYETIFYMHLKICVRQSLRKIKKWLGSREYYSLVEFTSHEPTTLISQLIHYHVQM